MLENISIVGVGLIGGSIGLAAQKYLAARRVIGVGRNQQSLDVALRNRAIHQATTELATGVRDADLIFVCTPIDRIAEHVLAISEVCKPDALITDAGSTKAELVKKIEAALKKKKESAGRFVGSHPMAGSEKNGAAYARADLFEGRATIVTPSKTTDAEAVARISAFWEQLGSKVFQMSPAEHDKAVAAISHVPHVIASALAASTPEAFLPLTAGGWLDSTRVASGDPELWRQILAQNRGHVLKHLDQFEKVLATLRKSLQSEDDAKLLKLLTAGKTLRDTVGSRHSSGPRTA